MRFSVVVAFFFASCGSSVSADSYALDNEAYDSKEEVSRLRGNGIVHEERTDITKSVVDAFTKMFSKLLGNAKIADKPVVEKALEEEFNKLLVNANDPNKYEELWKGAGPKYRLSLVNDMKKRSSA